MSPWFRWHEGTTEDGKFRVVSRNAGVTVRDVIALWAFMLEDAASAKHRGVCTRNGDFMAAILDFDGDEVSRILKAMELVEMIGPHVDGISVCNWGKRQYETDTKDATNAIRQKRYRQNNPNARKTDSKRDRNGSVTARNGDVTARKHTEAETDTEADKKDEAEASSPRKRRTAFPPGDWLTDSDREYATSRGLSDVGEFSRFRDHALDKGRLAKDWHAAWRNWITSPYQLSIKGNGHETAKDAGKRAWNEARAKVREYANAPNDGDIREPALRLLSAAGNRES